MQTTLNKIKLRESLRLTFNYNHLFTYYNFDSKWNNSWIVKPYRKRIRYSREIHCIERFKNNFLKCFVMSFEAWHGWRFSCAQSIYCVTLWPLQMPCEFVSKDVFISNDEFMTLERSTGELGHMWLKIFTIYFQIFTVRFSNSEFVFADPVIKLLIRVFF